MRTKEETAYMNFLISKGGCIKKNNINTTGIRKQTLRYVRDAVKLDVEKIKERIACKKFY